MRAFLSVLGAALVLLLAGPVHAQQTAAWIVPPKDTIAYFEHNGIPTAFYESAQIHKVDSLPPAFTDWWNLMKLCTGLPRGSLSDWTFYTVDAEAFMVEPWSIPFVGWTFAYPQRRIYVVGPRFLRGTTVPHEMVHALLFDNQKAPEHNAHTDRLMMRCGVL